MLNFSLYVLLLVSLSSETLEEAREEAREADSGVVTDAGPGLSTNNSPALDCRLSVLSTVSPSISLDNLDLGEEAATSSDSNRTIEAFTITEYDGSPRRYGSRKSGSKSSQQKSHQNPKIIRGFVYKYHTNIIIYTTNFFHFLPIKVGRGFILIFLNLQLSAACILNIFAPILN